MALIGAINGIAPSIGSGDRRSDSRPMGLEGSICGSRRFRRHHSRTVAWTERIARRVKAILWIHTPVIRRLPSSFRQLPVHGSCMFQRRSSGTVVRLYIVGAVHIADPLWPVADILWFRYRFQLAVCSERINACPSVSPSEKAAVTGAGLLAAGVAAQAIALWHVHSLWLFEACMCVSLLGLGLIFSTTNTLAMNEGRQHAGEASAVLGVAGYAVGAVVSPLVGMGDILHPQQ